MFKLKDTKQRIQFLKDHSELDINGIVNERMYEESRRNSVIKFKNYIDLMLYRGHWTMSNNIAEAKSQKR